MAGTQSGSAGVRLSVRLIADVVYVLLRDRVERRAHTDAMIAGQQRAAGWKVGNNPVPLIDIDEELVEFDQRLTRPLDFEKERAVALRLVDSA